MKRATTPPKKSPKPKKPAAAKSSAANTVTEGARTDPEVIAFLDDLDHPLRNEAAALRQLILDVDPSITEGIKWNAPSFRTSEWFATFNLRSRDRIRLVLHLGAKVKETSKTGIDIPDPHELLEWAGKDRALVSIEGAADLEAKRAPLQAVLRAWIRLV